jgi:hypothetical protein
VTDQRDYVQCRVMRADGNTLSHINKLYTVWAWSAAPVYAAKAAAATRTAHSIPGDEPLTVALWLRPHDEAVHYQAPIPDDATVLTFGGTGE